MSESLTLKERFQLGRFIKGEKPVNKPVELTHRRIFILPSRRGLGFLVLVMLILMIAFVYNNSMAYMLSFLLSGIFLVAILHTFRSLSGLVVSSGKSKPVFAGETAPFNIIIENPRGIKRINLQIKFKNSPVRHTDISAHSKTAVTLHSPTMQRGWHQPGTVTVFSQFPLGLLHAWSPLDFNLKTLVYPAPSASAGPFPVTPGASTEHGTIQKGNEDFYGLQEYQNGDSVKQIHWKAYAKGQGLYSKQFQGETSPELWLDLDNTSGQNLEDRLSRMCRWILEAETSGTRYGFKLPGLTLQPAVGVSHSKSCLEALALFDNP